MNPSKTKLLLVLIPITFLSILLLIAIPISKTSPKPHHLIHSHIHNQLNVAQSHCEGTRYPDLCVSTLSLIPDLHKRSMVDILCHTLNITRSEVRKCESKVSSIELHKPMPLTTLQSHALDDCLELLESTIDDIKAAYTDINQDPSRFYTDIQTVLSAAMTNQYTCLDGFAAASNRTIRSYIQPNIFNISRHVSNSLAMLKKTRHHHHHHSDFETTTRVSTDGFPEWLNKKDRRLLQAVGGGGNGTNNYDSVVAQDGTGNFTTINEAVAAAPAKSDKRFVIYIKAGAYFEYVEVDKKKTNIMFLGDGIGQTWIKGNRSVGDNYTTFRSATLAVVGKGFIAKGISVENYAGAIKHQAVALRSGSDQSAFYKCSFIGYQDTLYTHSLRQFYRDCDIYGTVDFIFGNSAVVFQNCNLYARAPLPNQKNMFTAQGREDPNQNTGISILNCKVTAASDLAANKSAFKSYLGRPWKEYSRTVYMLSNIDDVVDPAGWLEWSGDFALTTLYYGEYMNRGPGSNTSARVTWPGYRVINNSDEASQFNVANFVEGSEWLPSYNIPYYLNLTN